MAKPEARITLYTSNFCGHSWAIERFMKEHEIPVDLINIDQKPEAREQVMALNNGYASVPTLVFPDGTQLTEPSFRELRAKLDMNSAGLFDKIRDVFGGGTE
jgi:mycoredoxin